MPLEYTTSRPSTGYLSTGNDVDALSDTVDEHLEMMGVA